MKAIIHAGMHKTGSTSIQETFGRKRLLHHHYPVIAAHNHSFFLQALQAETFADFKRFNSAGLSAEEFEKRCEHYLVQFRKALVEARKTGAILISAEYISVMPRSGMERLRGMLAAECDTIDVFAYVRPPLSYMHSVFQQNLKGSSYNRLAPERLWPGYRRRFEALDSCFGRDNVRLKLFSRETLQGGDVVKDFAAIVGEPIAEEEIVRANESLSLEATALLFVQRRHGEGFRRGFRGAVRANARFIDRLSTIGTGKLAFAEALVEPVFAAKHEDLAWMEARLGRKLTERPKSGQQTIAHERDLTAIALKHEANVDALIERTLDRPLASVLADPIRRLRKRPAHGPLLKAYEQLSTSDLTPNLRLAKKLDLLHDVQA